MATAKEALDLYLKVFHSDLLHNKTIGRELLEEFSIDRKKTELQILSDYDYGYDKITEYYNSNPITESLKKELQVIRNRLNDLYDRDNNAFNRCFADFLCWWCNQPHAIDKMHYCHYCGIREDMIKSVMNNPRYMRSSKKSFSEKLQIDQKEPKKGYNDKNCVFACVLCNNAKSDMIAEEDFKKYIAPAIKEYWQSLLIEGND